MSERNIEERSQQQHLPLTLPTNNSSALPGLHELIVRSPGNLLVVVQDLVDELDRGGLPSIDR